MAVILNIIKTLKKSPAHLNIIFVSKSFLGVIFRKYSVNQLKSSDWISSKTQILQAVLMKFFMAWHNYFLTLTLLLHGFPLIISGTNIILQTSRKTPQNKRIYSATVLCLFWATIVAHSSVRVNLPPFRMTFLADVISETNIFYRLA